jgi:hypothetical protein
MSVRSLAASLVLVFATLTMPAGAQITRLDVTIPYEFTVGSRKLAAGQYLIHRPVPADPRVIGFRGSAKHQKAVVNTSTKSMDEPAADTELTFARYGDAYFLRTIRIRGAREYYDLAPSKSEKTMMATRDAVMVTLKVEGN